MAPLGLSMNRVAMDLRVPVTRIADIVNEKRAITADTALRFARYFNNSATFWMNLQTRYDLEVAEDKLADKVERDVRPLEAAPARQFKRGQQTNYGAA
jgi:antitoxin HigA-1